MSSERGFSYLMVLFIVAIAAAGLGTIGEVWRTTLQREKEAELLFVGNEMRNAIASYYHRSPGGRRQFPATLEDLVKDPRFPHTVRHLRRAYPDPVTGNADWGVVVAQGGGIMGVYSQSEAAPLKRRNFELVNASFADRAEALGEKLTYRDWQFVYIPGMPGMPRYP